MQDTFSVYDFSRIPEVLEPTSQVYPWDFSNYGATKGYYGR